MSEDALLAHLAFLGQKHLLAGFDSLSSEKKLAFSLQLKKFDAGLLQNQRNLLLQNKNIADGFKPLEKCESAGNAENIRIGEALISSGKVGCIILAGGQGTRLGSKGLKGAFPVAPVTGKSLFQLFFERAAAVVRKAQAALPIAVMTSSLNHKETEAFFSKHNWFGYLPGNVDLFQQKTLPFIDDRGNWLLEAPGRLAEGPDGNGNVLKEFFLSGIWERWQRRGIQYVNVIVVDNALADPFDAELCGFQERSGAEVVLKGVERRSADEKMGIIVEKQGKVQVVEYSELADQAFSQRHDDGSLRYCLANTSLFSFHMDFVRRIALDPQAALPWHLARKKANVLLGTAKGLFQEEVMIWKCETFIFDLLAYAKHSAVLFCPRELCYAPLKNASGEKSLKAVHDALLAFDREIFKKISGTTPPERPFELAPAFYYPSEVLLKQWKGRPLPNQGYIEE